MCALLFYLLFNVVGLALLLYFLPLLSALTTHFNLYSVQLILCMSSSYLPISYPLFLPHLHLPLLLWLLSWSLPIISLLLLLLPLLLLLLLLLSWPILLFLLLLCLLLCLLLLLLIFYL